jgi:hypothetical protein
VSAGKVDVLARWHLGSLNDGLFIVNRRPTPCGTDLAAGAPNGDPATVVLNITELPDAKAQAIVDAHNAAVEAFAGLVEAAKAQDALALSPCPDAPAPGTTDACARCGSVGPRCLRRHVEANLRAALMAVSP